MRRPLNPGPPAHLPRHVGDHPRHELLVAPPACAGDHEVRDAGVVLLSVTRSPAISPATPTAGRVKRPARFQATNAEGKDRRSSTRETRRSIRRSITIEILDTRPNGRARTDCWSFGYRRARRDEVRAVCGQEVPQLLNGPSEMFIHEGVVKEAAALHEGLGFAGAEDHLGDLCVRVSQPRPDTPLKLLARAEATRSASFGDAAWTWEHRRAKRAGKARGNVDGRGVREGCNQGRQGRGKRDGVAGKG